MRIVVDTNVLVSACIGRGAASKVIKACLAGRLKPMLSLALYLEYEDVVTRAPLFKRARLNLTERDEVLDAIFARAALVDVSFR